MTSMMSGIVDKDEMVTLILRMTLVSPDKGEGRWDCDWLVLESCRQVETS